jgi:hypothetical protein
VRPALRFESLIETMFTLAAEGKTNRKGLPNPLRLAVIAKAHFDTVRLPFPPAALQRIALAIGAPLGRAVGYRETVARPRIPRTARSLAATCVRRFSLAWSAAGIPTPDYVAAAQG